MKLLSSTVVAFLLLEGSFASEAPVSLEDEVEHIQELVPPASVEPGQRRIPDFIRDLLDLQLCTNTDAFAVEFLKETIQRIIDGGLDDDCDLMKAVILPRLKHCVLESTGITHTLYAGITVDAGIGLSGATSRGAYIDSEGREGCFRTSCTGFGANLGVGFGGVGGVLAGDAINDMPGVGFGGEVGVDFGQGFDFSGGLTTGGRPYAEISAGLGAGIYLGFQHCETETYGHSVTPCPKISKNGRCGPNHGDAICSTEYHPWAVYCSEHSGWCGNTPAHRDAQPSTKYDDGSMPEKCGCPKITTNGRCGPNHGDAICSTQYEPWAVYCSEHSGWCGNTPAHRDAQPSTKYDESNYPTECTACTKISKNGRCGPNHGGAICSTEYHDFAVYCSEHSGWCGNTPAHRDAQPSTAYDESSIPDVCEVETEYYSAMSAVAVHEGTHLISLASTPLEDCKAACTARRDCNSFAFCPGDGNGCYLKDIVLDGSEPVRNVGRSCRTYYQSAGTAEPVPAPVPAPVSPPASSPGLPHSTPCPPGHSCADGPGVFRRIEKISD